MVIIDKDFKRVLREAERQGWRVEVGAHNMKLWPPDPTQSMVVMAKTPSDRRALVNTIAKMRQRGFRWPPRKGRK